MSKEEDNSKKETNSEEIAESELEEELGDFEKEIDTGSFQKFIGNWSMENVSPSLERNISQEAPLEEIEEINIPSTRTETQFRDYAQKARENYNVVTEEEKRIYEIERQGETAPVLMPEFEENFSSRLVNPFSNRNLTSGNVENQSIELKRTHTRKRLPFEKDDNKYREVKL